MSANDKGDNEMIPRPVHRSHGMYLTTEENPGKLQLGDLYKGRETSHRSNTIPYLQMKLVGTSGREKEGKKERTGGFKYCNSTVNDCYSEDISAKGISMELKGIHGKDFEIVKTT